MIRLLTFILVAVFFAALITLMFSLGHSVHIEAFGWQADPPAGIASAFAALLLFAVGLLVSLYKDFAGLRRRAVLRGVIKRREKGVDVLVEAALAYRRADFGKADRLAHKASRLLDRDDVLTLFAPAAGPATPEPVEILTAPDPALVEPQPEMTEIAPTTEEHKAPALPTPAETATPSDDPELRAEETLDRDVAAARRVS